MAQASLPAPTHRQAVAPATHQDSTFSFDVAQVVHQVTGTGTPLVLIHGYPLSSTLFTYQQTRLAGPFRRHPRAAGRGEPGDHESGHGVRAPTCPGRDWPFSPGVHSAPRVQKAIDSRRQPARTAAPEGLAPDG